MYPRAHVSRLQCFCFPSHLAQVSANLPKTIHRQRLQRRFLNQSMVVLLYIRGNCSCLRAKVAHMVGHLPTLPVFRSLSRKDPPMKTYSLLRSCSIMIPCLHLAIIFSLLYSPSHGGNLWQRIFPSWSDLLQDGLPLVVYSTLMFGALVFPPLASWVASRLARSQVQVPVQPGRYAQLCRGRKTRAPSAPAVSGPAGAAGAMSL
jgi:hypothetical protein